MDRLSDELIRLLSTTDHKRFLYISSDPFNMDSLTHTILAAVDLSQTNSLVYMVDPEGVDKLVGAFHIVFCDRALKDLASSVSMHKDGYIVCVNEINGVIEHEGDI